MTGALIALLSGIGFGLFQTVNRRTLQDMEVYLSTFLLMVISTIVLAVVALLTEDLRLIPKTPWPALLIFMVAAFIHFFVGWTLLNASQKQVGASRTTLVIGTVPLFGTVGAALALREVPSTRVLIGILMVVAGVYFLSGEPVATGDDQRGRQPEAWNSTPGWHGLMAGLGAALCWSLSPILIRQGLRDLPSPLLGLLVGLVPCVAAYGLMLGRQRGAFGPISGETLALKVMAGVLVGLSQWARWEALHLAPIGVVLSLTQITAVLVVIVFSPMLVGRHLERVTSRVWIGALVILSGTLMLIWYQ